MKINLFRKEGEVQTLRAKLTKVFILFGALLLAVLWLFQSVFFEKYYESSMKRKVSLALDELCKCYSDTEYLSYDDFCVMMSSIGSMNDVYFFVESDNGSLRISSLDTGEQGVFFNQKSLDDARTMLKNSPTNSISFTFENGRQFISQRNIFGRDTERTTKEFKTIICAKRVKSDYRAAVNIFAAAAVTPMGPAVSIIRSQLLIVTGIVLILGVVIASILAKHLSSPMQEMSKEAVKLGQGNFDTEFKGADYQEINKLADTLNAAAKDLKASDELDKDLIANVSHDLRTPLTMIKSYAEMIKDISGDNKEKREEHLDVIINEADRMSDLVEDIFFISKVQSGTEEFHDEVFDLKEIAESVFATYRISEQDGFIMEFDAPDSYMVKGDKRKLSQVISNLLSNAIRYSDDEKFVRLSIREENGKVILEVSDHGIGIPESERDTVWNRYQKSSRSGKRSEEGTGLGLSICSEILKRENAEYGVQAADPKGSIFWFRMDAVKE